MAEGERKTRQRRAGRRGRGVADRVVKPSGPPAPQTPPLAPDEPAQAPLSAEFPEPGEAEPREAGPGEGLLVVSREELERREIKAYADGWRDALATFESARRRTDAWPGPPRLRLVHRRATDPAPAPAPAPGLGPRLDPDPTPDPAPDSIPDVPPGPGPGPDPVPVTESPLSPPSPPSPPRPAPTDPATPGLVPKNPSSRVPTIPRLAPPRNLGGPGRGVRREPPPEGASPARPDG
ncbi:hypothetical protein AB0O07_24700 [Streptomyces sp. NPDC093085]|uniref:hypothetical protein n=1 Tax=Streptomyces sp. NPDC093085 TaxID=3155068 RepID=UPI0034311532